MGTDKGLAGKTWSEPSHCPLGYTAWHFEPSEYSTYSVNVITTMQRN